MKLTTPKAIQAREKFIDSMAKKLADGGSVEKTIILHRRRHIRTANYIYLAVALSVISTGITYLLMTGRIGAGLTGNDSGLQTTFAKNTIDLLNDDLASGKISTDQYAIYLMNFLIRYDSLPDIYKPGKTFVTSDQVYRALFAVWPKISPQIRTFIMKEMPFLERKWEIYKVEQHQ